MLSGVTVIDVRINLEMILISNCKQEKVRMYCEGTGKTSSYIGLLFDCCSIYSLKLLKKSYIIDFMHIQIKIIL